MKKRVILAIVFVTSSIILSVQSKAGKVDSTKHTVLYTCPMHDSISMKKTGYCPVCGMKLEISKKEQMKKTVTKNYACPVHTEVYSHDPGKCSVCGRELNLSPKEHMKAKVVKLYTCPMHQEVALDKDGKCPKCGLKLIEKKKNE